MEVQVRKITEALASITSCYLLTITVNGADFTSDPSRELTFSSGSEIGSQQCFSIMTNVDNIVEGDQGFMVSLVDVNGDPADIVTIESPSDQIALIEDNIGSLTSAF